MNMPTTRGQKRKVTASFQAPSHKRKPEKLKEQLATEIVYMILEYALTLDEYIDHEAYEKFMDKQQRGVLIRLLSVFPQHKEFIMKTFYQNNKISICTPPYLHPSDVDRFRPRTPPALLPPRQLRQYVRDLSADFRLFCPHPLTPPERALARVPGLKTFITLTSLDGGFPSLGKLHVTLFANTWMYGNSSIGPGLLTALKERSIVWKAGHVEVTTGWRGNELRNRDQCVAEILTVVEIEQTAADSDGI
jgi:hypothetical protein